MKLPDFACCAIDKLYRRAVSYRAVRLFDGGWGAVGGFWQHWAVWVGRGRLVTGVGRKDGRGDIFGVDVVIRVGGPQGGSDADGVCR